MSPTETTRNTYEVTGPPQVVQDLRVRLMAEGYAVAPRPLVEERGPGEIITAVVTIIVDKAAEAKLEAFLDTFRTGSGGGTEIVRRDQP